VIEERREGASYDEVIFLESRESYCKQKKKLAEGWVAQ
jgi:hypothetical protein